MTEITNGVFLSEDLRTYEDRIEADQLAIELNMLGIDAALDWTSEWQDRLRRGLMAAEENK